MKRRPSGMDRAGREKDVRRSEQRMRDTRELTGVETGALVLRTSRGHAWLEAPGDGETHVRLPRWATLAPGDLVAIDPQGRVTGIVERRGILRRQAGVKGEQVLAANVDLAVIVVGPKLLLREGFLCRALCGAFSEKLDVLIVFQKADLDDDGVMRTRAMLYRDILGFDAIVTSAKTGEGVADVKARLAGKTSVFLGQSGVGKSTLVNAMFPELALKTGEVDAWGRGKHTTTLARAMRKGDAVLIDLPGVREFGLAELLPATLALVFPEIFEIGTRCKYPGCTHLDEADCAVLASLDALDDERVQHYQQIVRSFAAGDEGGGRS